MPSVYLIRTSVQCAFNISFQGCWHPVLNYMTLGLCFIISLSVLSRCSGGVRSEQHCGLLLVQRDPEHFNSYWWVRKSAVVDGAIPVVCLDSALCVLHPWHRNLRKGLKVALHLTNLMWVWCLIGGLFVQNSFRAYFIILSFLRLFTSPPHCHIWSSPFSSSEDWLWKEP